MYRIGIDVGSNYTKYCVMNSGNILKLEQELSPLQQKQYFKEKTEYYCKLYPGCSFASCGYGKGNIESIKSMNELIALAKGAFYLTESSGLVLDVGGQDTKIIEQENGKLNRFFLNDKCAAGSGLFLNNVLDRIGMDFANINLMGISEPSVILSSTCAVFAQSEIVDLIADNRSGEEIIRSVIWQIFAMSKKLLNKVTSESILLSGGLTQIPGLAEYASNALERKCIVIETSSYISAIGCALSLVD